MLSIPAARMGDQLILEEDHDESYIPQEHEIQEYARMIGVDPDAEAELMWLAREGIVAPLPPDWKPCQDVTGDIYYFNFATGQSTWDHPIDEHYRELVTQERAKLQAQGGAKKREKKKKKEKKKDKKVKELPKAALSLGTPLGPVQGPLGSLAPLRAVGESAGGSGGVRRSLSSSAGSSGGLDNLLAGPSGDSHVQPQKAATYVKSSAVKQPEERASLTLPGLEEEDEEPESEEQSPRGSARLLKNLHMDIGSLGGGFEYEELNESPSEHPSSRSTGQSSPRVQDTGMSKAQTEQPGESDIEVVHSTSPAEKEASLLNSFQSDAKEENSAASLAGNPIQDDSEPSEGARDLAKSSHDGLGTMDFGLGVRSLEKLLDISALSPGPLSLKGTIEEVAEDVEEDISEDHLKPVKDPEITVPDGKPASPTLDPAITEDESRLSDESLQNAAKEPKAEPIKAITELVEVMEEASKHSSDTSELVEEPEKMETEKEERQQLLELRKEEEEKKHGLYRQQKSNLRALEEKLDQETKREEEKLRGIQKQRLLQLERELNLEREEEEERMKIWAEDEGEKRKRALQQMEATRQEELLQDKNDLLEKMKKETENLLEQERKMLLGEREAALSELRAKLSQEAAELLESLEEKHLEDLKQLRAEVLEKPHKEASELQSIKQKEDSLTPSELYLANKKATQVLDFEAQMKDLLQEKREALQRDHESKLERMKEEHDQAVEEMRRQLEEEERAQKSQMLETLKNELGRIMLMQEQELESQRREQEKRREERQRSYLQQENKLQDLEENLEIRRKQLIMKTSQLDSQEETLVQRREKLEVQEKELERKLESIRAQDTAVTEQRQLNESVQLRRRELEEAQDHKSDLEAQIELLQSRCSRLQKIENDLEQEVSKRREDLKELKKEGAINPEQTELRMEDLRKSSGLLHSLTTPYGTELPKASSTPVRVPGLDSSIDDMRSYISSQGASIQRAKDFLCLQTRSMCRRQTLLKAAKQQWRHNMHEAQDPQESQKLEGIRKNLEEESHNLNHIRSTMEKGHVLLQEKEQRLQELEDSLLEEVSDDDTLKGRRNKKIVTFDVSDSDDTSSGTSIDVHRGDISVSPASLPLKVQHLTQSLRHITAELNSVLSSLSADPQPVPHTHNQPPLFTGLPVSAYASLSRISPQVGSHPLSHWAWRTGGHSKIASASAAQTVDAIMAEKWRKYFPGGTPLLGAPPLHTENKLGYVSAEEQLKSMRSVTFRAQQSDKQTMQAMIDTNRKWLENYKNDPKVLLPSRMSGSPTGKGFLQLGLDENDKIKVYHY
ncbi:centrosomal protein of 164 kDa isoform X3 [Eleutherodactylus coqui]|uniref:centrosomal protein of 164 kDa isoform X3 n=1 Tax=Eleutherodactylus coqui TaxID=57060 RepID=UPI0034625CB7